VSYLKLETFIHIKQKSKEPVYDISRTA